MKNAIIISTLLLVGLFAVAIAANAQTEKAAASIAVADAKLCKDIKERTASDEDSVFAANAKAFLWLKITGGASDSITVTWKHGEHSFQTVLAVGSDPWRTWASKTVSATGDWTVTVTDMQGSVLKEVNFKVQ